MRSIILVLFLALILRFISLNQSLWLDEAINVISARDLSAQTLFTQYSLDDFHPPLYHLVLHFWIQLFGASEIAVRLPSVIFGLITIYYLYRLTPLLLPRRSLTVGPLALPATLLPALLLATSGLHLYYSQEARMYALAAMAVTAVFYYLLRLLPPLPLSSLSTLIRRSFLLGQHTFDLKLSLGYILFLSLALWTDYLPWLLLPLLGLLLPWHTLLALISTVPWWPLLTSQLNRGLGVALDYPLWQQVVGGLSLKNILLIPVKFTLGRISLTNDYLYLLLMTPLLLFIAFILLQAFKAARQSTNLKFWLPWLWLSLPLVLGIGISATIPLLSYFRFLFILPAYYLLLSFGLLNLRKPQRSHPSLFLVAFNLITSLIYLFNPAFHRENWRGLSRWIDSHQNYQAITLFPNLNQAAPYLYYQSFVPATDKIDLTTLPDTVYLLRYVQEIYDPEDEHRQTLETLGYRLLDEHNFNGVVVWLYQKPSRIYALSL